MNISPGARQATASVLLALAAGVAQAATINVFDTSLPNLSGAFGGGTATTTTLAGPQLGTLTTVTGPGGNANRASAAFAADQWVQRNTGGGGSVGITTNFPRSGDGSAYFDGVNADSKSDLEILFSTPVALSDLTGLSYDWYRDGSSQFAGTHIVMRLMVGGTFNGNAVGGYLVYEQAYNGATVPNSSWVVDDIFGANFWATGSLPDAFAVYNRTLDGWLNVNGLTNLSVVGLSIGLGSGWSGNNIGAADNVTFATAAGSTTWNFEVLRQQQVPEPAGLALVGVGLLALIGARRRRDSH